MDSRIDASGLGSGMAAQLNTGEAAARRAEKQARAPRAEVQAAPPQVQRELVEVNMEAARAFLQIGDSEMPKIKTFERPEIDKILQNIKQNPEQALASQANMKRENVLRIIMPE